MKTVFLLTGLFFSGTLAAQTIVSAAGKESQGLSWTLGEVVTETIVTPDAVIVQGFNQPGETKETGIDPVDATGIAVRIYPNPVDDYLQLIAKDGKTYEWQLFDASGKIIMTGQSAGIDFSGKETGSYILNLTDGMQKQSLIILKK
jgi:hypothetical protein